jgi:methyl-accepting chemotaxis protein
MKIRGKIFFSVMSVSAAFFAVLVGILGTNFRNSELENSKKTADLYAKQVAGSVKASLDREMATARTIADGFSGYHQISSEIRNPIYNFVLQNALKEHKQYLATWVSWEIKAINFNWTKFYGRIRNIFVKKNGEINLQTDSLDLKGDDPRSLYYQIKIDKGREFITNPYFYSYGKANDSILETSFAVKIIDNGEYKGLVGIDVQLTELQNIIREKIQIDSSFIFLVADNGSITAHPDKNAVGKSLVQRLKIKNSINLIEKIQNGESFHVENIDENGKVISYTTFAPINIGESKTPWAVGVTVPMFVITAKADRSYFIIISAAVLGFILLSIVIYFVSRSITKPMKSAIDVLLKLDKGEISLSNKIHINRSDEIGQMAESLNNLIDTLNRTANFALNIGSGSFDEEFHAVGEQDILGNALTAMRINLQNSEAERKKRDLEQEKRNMIREGIAEVSEILQRTYTDVGELAYRIISRVAKIVHASQAGIFFTEKNPDGTRFLELKAAYAFEKKKRLEARLDFGESLVGRCAQEKELIYITDVPQGYTFINSGLGEESPTVLIVSPLIFENTLYGVLELASFNQIDDYQKEFIKTVSERIASIISTFQVGAETSVLLAQSQKQSEELATKEVEMQKTIEQMREIQFTSDLREQENKDILSAMMSMASVTFYDTHEKVIDINEKNFEIFGTKKQDLIGKTHAELIRETTDSPFYIGFWRDLRNGIQRQKEYYLKRNEQELWLNEIYTPIKDFEGNIIKILCIGIDITKEKLLEREVEKLKNN